MRECWVIERKDDYTGEWDAVLLFLSRASAERRYRAWFHRENHRVVRYVPDATVAVKDAEIARLRAQVQQWRDHMIENVADLYRHDPQAMADAIVRLREDVSALRAEKD